jgi:F0F1-type ATP synthase assembly protein I
MSLGLELVAPLLLGILVGYWLDGKLGTRPWIVIAGAVLGMTAGLIGFVRRVMPPRGTGGDGTGT